MTFRLGALLVLAVVADATLASRSATVGGVGTDLLLLVVAAVAAARGRTPGAAFGFAAGLAADAFLATPAGLSALAFTLVGQAVGVSTAAGGASRGTPPGPRASRGTPPGPRAPRGWRPWRSAFLGGAACLAGTGLVRAGVLLLGEAPLPPPGALLRTLAGAGLAALLAPAVFALVARLLALPAASA